MKYNLTPESGFSLVELAIVLLISGMMLGGAMTMVKPYIEMSQRNTTMMKQENIAKALANYAMQYGRLPCPADPTLNTVDYGTPRNSTGGTVVYAECGATYNITNHIGILPFKVLGLTEDNVRDSYGNLMTYAVTPVLAGRDPNSGSPDLNWDNTTVPVAKFSRVHGWCRSQKWIDDPSDKRKNKALLCCARFTLSAGFTVDMRVRDANGAVANPLLTTARDLPTDVDRSDYDFISVVDTPPFAVDLKPFIAYALISHGKNGDGAYIGRTGNRKPTTVIGGTTAEEYENRDNDRDFTSQSLNRTANNTYFDDIVLWRTNQQLVSEFGNDSCARP